MVKGRCIFCHKSSNSVDYNAVFKKKIDICLCNDCQLYFFANAPTDDFLNKYYSNTYFNEVQNHILISKLKSYFSKMRAYSQFNYIMKRCYIKPNGRVLEVGCGEGYLIYNFKKAGYDTKGLELNEYMVKKAQKKLGLDLKKEDLLQIKNEKFDLIIMSHVIEHFTDPIKILNHCKHLLNKGGTLFLEVPDSPLPPSKKVDLHEYLGTTHIFNFKAKSLELLIKASGFKLINVKKFGYNIPNLFHKYKQKISRLLIGVCFISYSPIVILGTICSVTNMYINYILKRDTLAIIPLNSKVDALGQNLRIIVIKSNN